MLKALLPSLGGAALRAAITDFQASPDTPGAKALFNFQSLNARLKPGSSTKTLFARG
jgi:hypothetical protein